MNKWMKQHMGLILSVLVVTVVIGLYAPFELYAINTDDLWFSLKDFWYMPIACSIMLFVVLLVVGSFLKGVLLRIYEGILSGVGIAAWLQANFGSLKLGEMDGHAIAWSNYYGEILVDGILWLICIGICIAFCLCRSSKIHKIIGAVDSFLSAMLLVSLIILLFPCINEDKTSAYGQATQKGLMDLSGEGDIVVFLVDMTDEDFLEQVLQEAPDIAESLEGFEYYSNMAACYAKTRWSIPYLMTGKEILRGEALSVVNELGESNVYWDELEKSGYEFGLYTDTYLVPDRMKENADNYVKAEFKISDKKRFLWTLYKFVLCKYAPDIVKPAVWFEGYEFEERKRLDSEYSCWTAYNLTFRDAMEEADIEVNKENPQYKFIHISGSHAPHSNDEYGERISGSTDLITCTKGAFRLVIRYMDQMKANDIYDSSSIIIMADHGDHQSYPTSPCFLVKKANAEGDLKENKAPVSHTDYPATILALAGLDYDAFGQSVFDFNEGDERERFYYMTSVYKTDGMGNSVCKLTEYQIDSEDNKTENYFATGREFDENGDLMN